MLLSDKLKEIYLQADKEIDETIARFHRENLDAAEIKAQIISRANKCANDMIKAAVQSVSDGLTNDEHPSMRNATAIIVQAINAYKCLYRELVKMQAMGEIGLVFLGDLMMEHALYMNYTTDVDEHTVKLINEIWRKYKFRKPNEN